MGGEVLAHLSRHPEPAHATSAAGTGGVVLMRSEAELVLQPVALPENADPGCVHSRTIVASDGSELARAVWFKPAAADAVAGMSSGCTESVVNRLRSWAGQQISEAPSTAVQQASGVYISLGNGILPGRDREAATLQGEGTLIPFSRAPMARSIEIEPVIGELNSAVAECLLLAFPDMDEWCVSFDGSGDDCTECDDWNRVCQYPRVPREGTRSLPSHQVVVRGHPAGNNPCSSGADLHIDKMDGGFRFGGSIVFCGGWEEGQGQWRDFAILEGRNGGRGAAVRVLSGDWICALCCRYNSKLHGTVFENVPSADVSAAPSSTPASSTPSSRPVCGPIQGLHVVSYNLRLIESFVARVGSSAAAEQCAVVEKLDSRLRSVALREVWHARELSSDKVCGV